MPAVGAPVWPQARPPSRLRQSVGPRPVSPVADPGGMTVIGTITFTKALSDEGRVVIDVQYDGMTTYEVIGLLAVELDSRRADVQEARRGESRG